MSLFPEFLKKIEIFEKIVNGKKEYFFPIYNFTFCPYCKEIKRVVYYNTRNENEADWILSCNRMRFPECGHNFLESESRPLLEFPEREWKKWHKMMKVKFQLEFLKNEIKNKLMTETAAYTVRKEELKELLLRVTKLGSKNKKAKKEK